MKREQLKHRFFSSLRLKESWVIFFILGIIMLNYPFLDIFNKSIDILGFPILVIYFTGGWFISILVIYLFSKSINTTENRE